MRIFESKIGRGFLALALASIICVAPHDFARAEIYPPTAQSGVLDLRDWDFKTDGAIALDGEWGFVWQELVSPSDLYSLRNAPNVFIPHDWRQSQVNGNSSDGSGFATYHLQILLPANTPPLAFETGSIYHTFQLFLNGKLVAEQGQPGEDDHSEQSVSMTALYTPISVEAQASDNLSLVVHVSNFVHAEGGIRQSIILGDAKHLKRSHNIRWVVLVLMIGAALALAFYHFSLYFARQRDWVFVSFGGLLVAVAVHGTCTLGMIPISSPLPIDLTALALKLEYLALVLGSVAGVNFVWRLYPQVCWKFAHRAFVVYAAIAGLSITILEPMTFTGLLPIYKIGMLAAIGACLISVAVAAFKKLPGSYLFLLGVFVLGLGVGSSIMGHTVTHAAVGIRAYISISFLILAQGVIVGRRITTAFETSERLRSSLARANLELEDQVEERTKLLTQSTEEAHIAKEEAVQANRVKSEFLAMMSHEIRTPLNGVLGMAGLLANSDLSNDQHSKLEAIRQSGDDLLYLLNDILDYSKIEAGQLKLESREFNLAAVINRCARLWEPQAKAKGLRFNLEVDCPEHLNVVGDDHRLLQVTSNLVSNAFKFTSCGGITLRVEILSRERDESSVRISVTDSGSGIPLDAQGRLFSSFVQGDITITRKYGGSGLGLSICKRLTEMMGGTIEFWSWEGKGSKFWIDITLPEASNGSEHEGGSSFTKSDGATQKRMLVVDDNAINRRLACELLQAEGHKVETAVNGYEAVQIVISAAPGYFDAVIMDVHMPKMNGTDATREIRQHYGNNDLPIIGLTADAMAGDKEKLLNAGMSAYVTKPINPDEFFAAIEESCAQEKTSSTTNQSTKNRLAS